MAKIKIIFYKENKADWEHPRGHLRISYRTKLLRGLITWTCIFETEETMVLKWGRGEMLILSCERVFISWCICRKNIGRMTWKPTRVSSDVRKCQSVIVREISQRAKISVSCFIYIIKQRSCCVLVSCSQVNAGCSRRWTYLSFVCSEESVAPCCFHIQEERFSN